MPWCYSPPSPRLSGKVEAFLLNKYNLHMSLVDMQDSYLPKTSPSKNPVGKIMEREETHHEYQHDSS